MEAELEEERKQRGMANSSKKKLEGDLKDLAASVENANKAKEDSVRQQRRLQVGMRLFYYVSFYLHGNYTSYVK